MSPPEGGLELMPCSVQLKLLPTIIRFPDPFILPEKHSPSKTASSSTASMSLFAEKVLSVQTCDLSSSEAPESSYVTKSICLPTHPINLSTVFSFLLLPSSSSFFFFSLRTPNLHGDGVEMELLLPCRLLYISCPGIKCSLST